MLSVQAQAAIETQPPATAGGAPIVARSVGKQFAGKSGLFTALEDVSFDIRGGEFVSLIGPSGCGKSTLMLITAGLVPASSSSADKSCSAR